MELPTLLLHATLVVALFGVTAQGSSYTGFDVDLQQDRKVWLHSLARDALHLPNCRDAKFPAIALVCHGRVGETIRQNDPAIQQGGLNHLFDVLRA